MGLQLLPALRVDGCGKRREPASVTALHVREARQVGGLRQCVQPRRNLLLPLAMAALGHGRVGSGFAGAGFGASGFGGAGICSLDRRGSSSSTRSPRISRGTPGREITYLPSAAPGLAGSTISTMKQGAVPMVMTPEQFDAYLKKDIDKWAEVVKVSGAKIQ